MEIGVGTIHGTGNTVHQCRFTSEVHRKDQVIWKLVSTTSSYQGHGVETLVMSKWDI